VLERELQAIRGPKPATAEVSAAGASANLPAPAVIPPSEDLGPEEEESWLPPGEADATTRTRTRF